MKLSLKKILILLGVALVLIIGIIGWFISQKEKLPSKKEIPEKEMIGEKIFSLIAKVSKIDTKNNTLIVKPIEEEKEIKVILDKNTEIIKLEFPFPLSETSEKEFTLKRTKIGIQDLKEGEKIFIKTHKSIAGKNEFDEVDFIEVLP
jgi:hypothetical protein